MMSPSKSCPTVTLDGYININIRGT
jgi:hypothetical protein